MTQKAGQLKAVRLFCDPNDITISISSSSLSENALVPQAPPGNEHWEALPPGETGGKASEMPLPGRTWERERAKFRLLRQAARYVRFGQQYVPQNPLVEESSPRMGCWPNGRFRSANHLSHQLIG
jgi:hypothetical protein